MYYDEHFLIYGSCPKSCNANLQTLHCKVQESSLQTVVLFEGIEFYKLKYQTETTNNMFLWVNKYINLTHILLNLL